MASTTLTAGQAAIPADRLEGLIIPKRGFPIGQIIGKILFWLLIVFILFYTLFPFYWAIVSSLTSDSQLFNTPASYWPSTIDWSHYQFVLRNDDFLRALQNSVVVSVGTVIIALLFGSLAAYALGRFQFRGAPRCSTSMLSMTMFPSVAILGSLFLMIRGEWFLNTPNLYNTRIALVITYLIFTLPFTVWVMTQFFKAMPGELEEAALVDGAGPMRVFWQISCRWPRRAGDDRSAGLHRRVERVPLRADVHQQLRSPHSTSRDFPVFRANPVRTAIRQPDGGVRDRHAAIDHPGADLPAEDPGRSDSGGSQGVERRWEPPSTSSLSSVLELATVGPS